MGMLLGFLSLAATPTSGILTESHTASNPLTYTAGPFFAPNVFGNTIPGECEPDPSFPLVPCDIYKLTVTLPDGYETAHPNTSVLVRVEWGNPAADFDLYFWDAASWSGGDSFPQGSPLARSVQQATTFEQLEIPALGGTHQYVVQVSTTLPAGQSFSGKMFLAPATIAPVVPPGNAAGIPPRFELYVPSDASGAPSAKLGIFAAEPTIFGNPLTGNVFMIAVYEVLRATFDDSTSPAKVTWVPKDQPTNISNHVTLDPILWGDSLPHGNPPTHRLFSLQLAGGQSLSDYSDDDGETWLPALSGGILSGADHQGLGGGPYPPNVFPPIRHPLYPNALYYCSQHVAAAFCSRSDDGGQTYGPIVPMYEAGITRCVGLHGHPKVAPDGTVYVPDKGCGLDTPVLGNGNVSAIVSTDAGRTWTVKMVQDSTGGLTSKGDPSIGIDKAGKVYLAYQNLADNHLRVTTTTNRGDTWTPSVDVGALAGVNYAVFPAATAGDSGRAAVAFFGSTYNGPMTDFGSMAFPGVWYLYIATTYDGGNTWFVTNAMPDQPVQGAFGGIGNGGDNRNHYDFIDCEIDGQGRVIVSTTIGCAGSCPQNGGPNTFQTLGNIVRQSGGRRMLATFDPVEPAKPQPPLINGYRTSQFVSLSWPEADGSGLPVTGYNIYRSINSGPETKILGPTTQRHLVDPADSAQTYSYRVTALNSQGESNFSNIFAPTVGQNAPHPELSCSLPGQVYADRTSEGGTFPNNDIASFSIAEPSNMPGKLVFVINNTQPELVQGGNSDFYVFFDPARGAKTLRLSLSDMQVTDYKNGQFVSTCGTAGTDDCRDWQPVGPLDPASGIQADGSVWLVIDKATFDIQKGDVLLGVFIREDTVGNPSRILASDFAGGRQDYLVVGNDFCTTPPIPTKIVSRKTHGTADFDVDLLPPAAGIECRSGGANGVFKIIVTFPLPVTLSGSPQASVTSGTGTVSNVTINGTEVVVDLTGVTNAQRLVVTLNGVSIGGGSGNLPVNVAFLSGDTNEDGDVNSADISQTKSQSGTALMNSNFRTDVNIDGAINSADISAVKSRSGTGLPSSASADSPTTTPPPSTATTPAPAKKRQIPTSRLTQPQR
ncbi:MAG TPA: dockerin type I domain-containing protein [Verrucomicrobiae bacterium]|nr:dockerin type I domain-containing protein [Verrucomicrobiae bacterium]